MKRKDNLMRPVSVSISPAMAEELQRRASAMTPEAPNVSAYVRRLIFDDLEGRGMDRKRALSIYRELEQVDGFLDSLRLFDSIPKRVADKAAACQGIVRSVRDAVWSMAGKMD